jgi:hypothetical protein
MPSRPSYRFILAAAFGAAAAAVLAQPASFHQDRLLQQAMSTPRFDPLRKMRVYLKDGSKSPPLDSFRLGSGKSALWRHEREEALLFTGGNCFVPARKTSACWSETIRRRRGG